MNQLHLSKICLLTDCPSNRPPVLPSFPGSADTSISCSSLSSCLSCPGCVDSSSVSRHGGALRRHGQWSGACALSADGQPAILSHAGLRSKFSFTTKVYFTCSLTCCSSQSLFSCDPFPIPTSPSIGDHLAGEPTEKPTDRKHTQPSLEGLRSESLPAKPRESQSIFAFLSVSPMMCLHRDSMPACEDVPSCMNKTALKTHERLTE